MIMLHKGIANEIWISLDNLFIATFSWWDQ